MSQRKVLAILFLGVLILSMEFPAFSQKVTITRESAPGPMPSQSTVSQVYEYYPADQVYFNSSSGVWYWQEAGAWSSGYRLPARFSSIPQRTRLLIDSDTPYEYHQRLVRPGIVKKEITLVPAPPVQEYRYTYFPDTEVYYDNNANEYLWTENGIWKEANVG